MAHHIATKRLTPPRAFLLALATLLSGAMLTGCGGTSGGSTTTGSESVAGESGGAGVSNSDSQPSLARMQQSALAFARCMRSNGVPNFPDPQPGGGFLFHASHEVISSPAFKAAQAKCQKLMPGGGPPGPGTQTHPSARTLARFRAIARCMRGHGVPAFPDPRTSVPPNPFGSNSDGGVISDIEEVIFIFPATIIQQSPAFAQAAAACHFPLHNH
jgi:hypothetical protein